MEFDLLEINYEKIREYRNNVMHAHNINYQDYIAAKSLFHDINKEISAQTENIIIKDIRYFVNVESFQYIAKQFLDRKDQINTKINQSELFESILRLQEMSKSFFNHFLTQEAENAIKQLGKFSINLQDKSFEY